LHRDWNLATAPAFTKAAAARFNTDAPMRVIPSRLPPRSLPASLQRIALKVRNFFDACAFGLEIDQ
jgi:hypothetical protein